MGQESLKEEPKTYFKYICFVQKNGSSTTKQVEKVFKGTSLLVKINITVRIRKTKYKCYSKLL